MDSQSSAEPSALFLHDFVGIDLPLPIVLALVGTLLTSDLINDLACSAWNAEASAVDAVAHRAHLDATPVLCVEVGDRRHRDDAEIVPIRWRCRSDHPVPPLEADLEFAAFGSDRTHLHLYGHSQLPRGTEPRSTRSSMAQRFTVATVRHFLQLLDDRIMAAYWLTRWTE